MTSKYLHVTLFDILAAHTFLIIWVISDSVVVLIKCFLLQACGTGLTVTPSPQVTLGIVVRERIQAPGTPGIQISSNQAISPQLSQELRTKSSSEKNRRK